MRCGICTEEHCHYRATDGECFYEAYAEVPTDAYEVIDTEKITIKKQVKDMTAKDIIERLIDEHKITGEEAVILLDAINITKVVEKEIIQPWITTPSPIVPYYVANPEPQKFEITCKQ